MKERGILNCLHHLQLTLEKARARACARARVRVCVCACVCVCVCVRACVRSLTRRLHLVDVLQQLLSLVDDVEGEVVDGQGLVGVVLELLLGQGQVLRVKLTHLARQLLVPRLQVRDYLGRGGACTRQ